MLKSTLDQLLSSPDALLSDELRTKLRSVPTASPKRAEAAKIQALRALLIEAKCGIEAGIQALAGHVDESRQQWLVHGVADIKTNTAALREGIALEQQDWISHRLAIQRNDCQRAWWPDDTSVKLAEDDVAFARSAGSRRSRMSLNTTTARGLALDQALQLYALLAHNVGTFTEEGRRAAGRGVQNALLRHFNPQDPRNAFQAHAQACVDLRATFGQDISWPAWPEVSTALTNLPSPAALAQGLSVAPPGASQQYPFPQSTSIYFDGKKMAEQYAALYVDFVAPTWGKALMDTLRPNLMLLMLVVSTSTQIVDTPASKVVVALSVFCTIAVWLVLLATAGWKNDVKDARRTALKQLDARLKVTVVKQQLEFGSLLARAVSAFHANARGALDTQVAEQTRHYERLAKERLLALQRDVKARVDAASAIATALGAIITDLNGALAGANEMTPLTKAAHP